MRILYIAKHDNGGNDDEGAIRYALQDVLGHDVIRLHEKRSKAASRLTESIDFVLFHKWDAIDVLSKLEVPKVCWYFDLIDAKDPSVSRRSQIRIEWMQRTIPAVDLMFCTDGDWVEQDTSGKLLRLTQGSDGRVVGRGNKPDDPDRHCALLFTGNRTGGDRRRRFVDEMQINYRGSFHHVENRYGSALADEIAGSQIVIAPDYPVTDRYWSNRVYVSLGFGAFLFHPYCKTLNDQYTDGEELFMYHTRDQLHDLIKTYYHDDETRLRVSSAALERTRREHLYEHRCAQMIETIQQRLKL